MDWFEEQSKILEEIIEFIKSELPFETYSSILSYFLLYYSELNFKQYYYNFICKTMYKFNKYKHIIEEPKYYWSKNMFIGVFHSLARSNKKYRYVFLYLPYKSNYYFCLDNKDIKSKYKEKEWNKYCQNNYFIEYTNFYY